MLFCWIDKRGRLGEELDVVLRGDSLAHFALSKSRHDQAVIGARAGGVYAVANHETAEHTAWSWGELYNRAELTRLLSIEAGDPAPNDARLMSALVERFGPEGLARANGQFALLQWNRATGRLLAAADQFSILPLRYYEDEDRLIVASDLRMILACPNVRARVDPQAVFDYVSMSIIPEPATIYDSIRKLPPRHVLTYDGRTVVRAYSQLTFPEDAAGGWAELGAELRRIITDAVDRRRLADPDGARVGAFLSGGLDSSTVVGTLTERGDDPVRAFSIGFAESRFDEMDYAKLVAGRFRAEHHTYDVTAEDTDAVVDAVLDQFDEPFGNSSAVPVFYCAKLAAEAGVDTLYGGDGGDELFAGNPHYLWDRYFQVYHAIPLFLRRRLIEPIVRHWPLGDRIGPVRKARSYIRRANTPNPERIVGYGFLETVPPGDVFNPDFLSSVDTDHPMAVRRRHFNTAGARSELYRILNHELALVVADNDLRKVTEMSARAGVRVVYPMLDPELVAFAGRLPASWHLRRFKLRAFYKQAMRGFLPDAVLAKEKKGFGLPVSIWLKQDTAVRRRMLDAFAGRAGDNVFRPGFLPELQRRVDADPTNYHGSIAWVLMILLEWLRRKG
ncbi:MAG: asparagine synthase [Phycisphaerae bacterium]|nr:asparagine synthase [Phycisphaerae bacterium]